MAVLSIRHKILISVAALYLFMGASLFGAYYFMHRLDDKIALQRDLWYIQDFKHAPLSM